MRGIAAVRPGSHVATESCRASRAAVAGTATVRKACSKSIVEIDALVAIELGTALSFCSDKFALEELPSATHCSKRVPLNDVHGGIGHCFVTASGPDLLAE